MKRRAIIALSIFCLISAGCKKQPANTDQAPIVNNVPITSQAPNAQQAPVIIQTFNSTLSLAVSIRRGTFADQGLRPDYQSSIGIGKTPAAEPIDIPQCMYWFVRPTGSCDVAALAREIQAKQIPGLSLQAWTSTNDDDLEHLSDLTDMVVLWLQAGSAVTDAGLMHLSSLTKLRELHLAGLDITDEGLTHLAHLTELQFLDLSLTSITDNGLVHLRGLTGAAVSGLVRYKYY